MSYNFSMYTKPKNERTDESVDYQIYLESNERFTDHAGRESYTLDFEVTYNYTRIIDPIFDEALKTIYNKETKDIWALFFIDKTGKYMEPILKLMITKLGNDEPDEDYFICTKGNCRVALETLLKMCKLRPDGIFWVC